MVNYIARGARGEGRRCEGSSQTRAEGKKGAKDVVEGSELAGEGRVEAREGRERERKGEGTGGRKALLMTIKHIGLGIIHEFMVMIS